MNADSTSLPYSLTERIEKHVAEAPYCRDDEQRALYRTGIETGIRWAMEQPEDTPSEKQVGDFTLQDAPGLPSCIAIEDRWWKLSELQAIIREWKRRNTEQANSRIEITDEMVEKAAAAIMRRYVDCGAFADDDSSVTAMDRDAARKGLEAALNG